MYPTYILEVLWGDVWVELQSAHDPRKRLWLSQHMRDLADDPERPEKANGYRIVTPSIYADQPAEVVERAA